MEDFDLLYEIHGDPKVGYVNVSTTLEEGEGVLSYYVFDKNKALIDGGYVTAKRDAALAEIAKMHAFAPGHTAVLAEEWPDLEDFTGW